MFVVIIKTWLQTPCSALEYQYLSSNFIYKCSFLISHVSTDHLVGLVPAIHVGTIDNAWGSWRQSDPSLEEIVGTWVVNQWIEVLSFLNK